MKIYRIQTNELLWYNCVYEVVAESEEEAIILVENGDAKMINNSYDSTEQINIENITKIE